MISRIGNIPKRQVYMVRKWIHGRQGLEGWGWDRERLFGGNKVSLGTMEMF